MPRKPVNQECAENKGKSYGRQAMWEAMRELGDFTVREIALASQRDTSSVRAFIKRLLPAGIVGEAGTKTSPRNNAPMYQVKVYRLVRDTGLLAPRLTPHGKPLIEGRDQMWRTMKMLSRFTVEELAAASSTEERIVSPVDSADFCKHLHKAGYLIMLEPGTTRGKAVYRLLPSMNTGPLAPMVQRTKVVFDPNRQEVMWHEDIEP